MTLHNTVSVLTQYTGRFQGAVAIAAGSLIGAVLLWEMPYWDPVKSAHKDAINLVFADGHAALEKRMVDEVDWWAFHSRRGWDDADPTGKTKKQ